MTSVEMTHADDLRDDELLAAGKIGDLLAIYEPVILYRCIANLRGSADAEDVAQEVRLRLLKEFRAGKRYDVPFRVAVHQIVGWKVKEYFRDQPDAVPLPETWEVAGDDDPECEVVGRQWVAEAIARLDGRERQVLELRYWYGMEHDQIALELQITRNNVDQILWRGHKTIREALGV
jgi:RNA polymerase sigma factor (sigma-70 family)